MGFRGGGLQRPGRFAKRGKTGARGTWARGQRLIGFGAELVYHFNAKTLDRVHHFLFVAKCFGACLAAECFAHQPALRNDADLKQLSKITARDAAELGKWKAGRCVGRAAVEPCDKPRRLDVGGQTGIQIAADRRAPPPPAAVDVLDGLALAVNVHHTKLGEFVVERLGHGGIPRRSSIAQRGARDDGSNNVRRRIIPCERGWFLGEGRNGHLAVPGTELVPGANDNAEALGLANRRFPRDIRAIRIRKPRPPLGELHPNVVASVSPVHMESAAFARGDTFGNTVVCVFDNIDGLTNVGEIQEPGAACIQDASVDFARAVMGVIPAFVAVAAKRGGLCDGVERKRTGKWNGSKPHPGSCRPAAAGREQAGCPNENGPEQAELGEVSGRNGGHARLHERLSDPLRAGRVESSVVPRRQTGNGQPLMAGLFSGDNVEY